MSCMGLNSTICGSTIDEDEHETGASSRVRRTSGAHPHRNRRALSAAKQREWKERLAHYLLETLKVTGLQESKRECVWSQERKDVREYDPETDRLYLVREKVHVMRASCTPAQLDAFRKGGEALLVQMGRALNQEAVAYETRAGITILTL